MNKNTSSSHATAIFSETHHLRLECNDADEMGEKSAYWAYRHKQFGKGRFHGKIFATNTARLQLSVTSRAPGIFITGGIPRGATVISFPLSKTSLPIYRGHPLEDDQAVALKSDEELEFLSKTPFTMLTVAVSSDFLERKVLEITGKPLADLRFQERLSLMKPGRTRRTDRLMSLLTSHWGKVGTIDEGVAETFEDQVLESLFLGVSHPGCEKEHAQRILQAKTAEEFIRANLKRPISMSDLTRVTGASERTLYLGFKERYGSSPASFVLMMKLNEVRNELLTGNANVSITNIAMRWGFFHLGRFAEQYQRLFGELPSETLRSVRQARGHLS